MINPDKRAALEKFGAIVLVSHSGRLARQPGVALPGPWESVECQSGVLHYLPPAMAHTLPDGSVVACLGSPFRTANTLDAFKQTVESVTKTGVGRYQDMLASFDGQFCVFALSDAHATALCATDRIGTRPVYWHQPPGAGCIAASDLDLLRAVASTEQPALCYQAIYNYIFHHCIPSPLTAFQAYLKLGPATALDLSSASPQTSRWWLPDFSNQSGKDKDGLMRRLRQTLSDAVRTQAQTEAGKTGAFLSGGLDSSTVAGYLAEHCAPAKATTFSIGFDEPDYDERSWARITSARFKTEQVELELKPSDIAPALRKAAAYYAEPFGNSSVIPTYYCAKLAREHGFSHLLAGDGGDELYAGNDRYAKQKLFQVWWKLPGFIQFLVRLPFQLISPLKSVPVIRKIWRYVEQAEVPLPDRLQSYNFLVRFKPEDVFSETVFSEIDPEYPFETLRERYQEIRDAHAVDRMLYLDWKFTLADNDLMKVTQMCHLAGIDVSYPMLDSGLLEIAEEIPAGWKLPGLKLRDFYKKAFGEFLAPETIGKPKHGFGLPFGVWLKTDMELKELANSSLVQLKSRGLFQEQFIDRALDTHEADDAASYYGELVWILMMLELWLAKHE